jgi:TonB family protein
VPPPEVQVAQQPQAPTITTTNVQPPPQEVKISQAAPAVQAPRRRPHRAGAARPAIADISACAPKGSDYPAAAARAQATGTTRVRFTVDAVGKLAKAEVVKSAGPSREHRMLDRIAVDKLSECVPPGMDENGHPPVARSSSSTSGPCSKPFLNRPPARRPAGVTGLLPWIPLGVNMSFLKLLRAPLVAATIAFTGTLPLAALAQETASAPAASAPADVTAPPLARCPRPRPRRKPSTTPTAWMRCGARATSWPAAR